MSEACVHVQGDKGTQVCFHQDYSCGTAAARGLQPMSEGQHFWEIKMDSPVYGTAMVIFMVIISCAIIKQPTCESFIKLSQL